MILYLLKCTIAMGVSWLVYRLLLSQQKSFTLNRVYLLIAIIGSSVAPLIVLPSIFPRVLFTQSSESLRDADVTTIADITNTSVATYSNPLIDNIPYVIVILSFLFFIRFVLQMIKMIHLSKAPIIDRKEGIRIASINDERTPFSFFKTIFINSSIIQEGISNSVFQHEKYHIQQWHSIDRIVVGFIGVVQWMNPFLHLLKKDLIDNHEYAADAYVIDQTQDTQGYLSTILSQVAISSHHGFLLQHFSHSSSKKRIKMITAIPSNKRKWHLLLAFTLVLCCLVSCSDDIVDSTNHINTFPLENNFLTKSLIIKQMVDDEIPFPPSRLALNRPSNHLFKTWMNKETFAIFIDQKKVDNHLLKDKNTDDFSKFKVSRTTKENKALEEVDFKVELMTNKSYENIMLQQNKLIKDYKEKYPDVWSAFELEKGHRIVKRSDGCISYNISKLL